MDVGHHDSERAGAIWQNFGNLCNCPVTERYVLDLAYTREPEPVDEDDL